MEALARAVREDRDAGFNPITVCANAGAASTGAIDPLEAMADFCAAEKVWLHVDAAYGGFAAVTEVGRKHLRGIERADSIGMAAHKWFFQPYEAGCLLVKDSRTLEDAFRVGHDILQDTIWGKNHPNIADRGLQLSRSFRALKVWMSIQTFGMAAFRRAVSKGMELAARAEAYVRESAMLELLTPVSLSIVCLRVKPASTDMSEEILEEVNRTVLARVFWEDPGFFRPRFSRASSLCGCASSTTTRPGMTSAKPWSPSSGTAPRRAPEAPAANDALGTMTADRPSAAGEGREASARWEVPEPLAMVEVRMDDGTPITLRRHGNPQGTRRVLSHANGLSADSYYPFWSLPTDRFDLILYDVRNHGWNPVGDPVGNPVGDLEAHDIATFVRDNERIVQAIDRHFGDTPKIGVFHSLSAQTAMLQVAASGGFSALVLFDPFICPPGCAPQHLETLGATIDQLDEGARAKGNIRYRRSVRRAHPTRSRLPTPGPRRRRPHRANDASPGPRWRGIRTALPARL